MMIGQKETVDELALVKAFNKSNGKELDDMLCIYDDEEDFYDSCFFPERLPADVKQFIKYYYISKFLND